MMWLALVLALTLSGCSTLLLHEEDAPLTITGKVAARVPIAILTFGLSELALHDEAERLAYIEWYQSLSEQDQDREDRRRHHSAPMLIVTPQPYRPYMLPIR